MKNALRKNLFFFSPRIASPRTGLRSWLPCHTNVTSELDSQVGDSLEALLTIFMKKKPLALLALVGGPSSFFGRSECVYRLRTENLLRSIKKIIDFFWKRKKLETCFENFRKKMRLKNRKFSISDRNFHFHSLFNGNFRSQNFSFSYKFAI